VEKIEKEGELRKKKSKGVEKRKNKRDRIGSA